MRFEREAQVLASLNPPNIAQVYGIEEGSTPVDGPTGTLGAARRYRAIVLELMKAIPRRHCAC